MGNGGLSTAEVRENDRLYAEQLKKEDEERRARVKQKMEDEDASRAAVGEAAKEANRLITIALLKKCGDAETKTSVTATTATSVKKLMEILFEENDDLAPVHQLTVKYQNKVIKIDSTSIANLPNAPPADAQSQPSGVSGAAEPLIVEYKEGARAAWDAREEDLAQKEATRKEEMERRKVLQKAENVKRVKCDVKIMFEHQKTKIVVLSDMKVTGSNTLRECKAKWLVEVQHRLGNDQRSVPPPAMWDVICYYKTGMDIVAASPMYTRKYLIEDEDAMIGSSLGMHDHAIVNITFKPEATGLVMPSYSSPELSSIALDIGIAPDESETAMLHMEVC